MTDEEQRLCFVEEAEPWVYSLTIFCLIYQIIVAITSLIFCASASASAIVAASL